MHKRIRNPYSLFIRWAFCLLAACFTPTEASSHGVEEDFKEVEEKVWVLSSKSQTVSAQDKKSADNGYPLPIHSISWVELHVRGNNVPLYKLLTCWRFCE